MTTTPRSYWRGCSTSSPRTSDRAIVARLRAGAKAKAERYPHARAQGGKVPYGYRRTPTTLEVDPEQAAHVRRVFDLIRSGSTLRATAETMTAETGHPWKPQVIAGIVKREVYKLAEPGRVVDPRVWNQAQRALASRRRRPAQTA